MTKLPEIFVETMKELLGGEWQSYLDSFERPRWCGVRVNTLKVRHEDMEEALPFPVRKIPWINHGFYYEEEIKPAKDPYYYAGLYYLQEPSAMTPAELFPVEPGDMVLDLCAAPGGKSTELGARLKGQGLLVSNDISNSRAKALLKNLELFGIGNVCVTSETPEKLAETFGCVFDKILVDAPCSGEGMFRKNPDMIKSWQERGPKDYVPLQKEILSQAVRMLKPGGYLMYSTCTFSVMEDEQVVTWLTDQGEVERVPMKQQHGFSPGFGLDGCIRLFPHKLEGEGHFLALMRKHGDGEPPKQSKVRGRNHVSGEIRQLYEETDFPEFERLLAHSFDKSRLMVKHELVYELPALFQPEWNLRYLRTGLLLGELKRGRFEPSQALAMTMGKETFQNSISFSRQDERVIRYLKGETVVLNQGEKPIKGWCLVCVDNYPLGWAKGMGMNLKNKYYPGWRWQ